MNGIKTLEQVKEDHILKVLMHTQGNVTQASLILDIALRTMRVHVRELERKGLYDRSQIKRPRVNEEPKKKIDLSHQVQGRPLTEKEILQREKERYQMLNGGKCEEYGYSDN